jgi:hypothetical protein
MNLSVFYKKVRAEFFNGRLSQQQTDGMAAILQKWERSGFTDIRWLAYMLGTTYHETARTMYPIEEYGKGMGRRYGKKIKQSGKPYDEPDQIYYGRGYVQLTWYENYERMGRILGIPLLQQPELALVPEHAADIMFEGMTKSVSFKGDFTGHYLEQYFNGAKEDWVNARRIINGRDRAELIADYAIRFYEILKSS